MLNLNFKISKAKKLPLVLLCEKKSISFYQKRNWLIVENKSKKFIFKDFKNTKHIMIYAKKNFLNKLKLSNKVSFFLKR